MKLFPKWWRERPDWLEREDRGPPPPETKQRDVSHFIYRAKPGQSFDEAMTEAGSYGCEEFFRNWRLYRVSPHPQVGQAVDDWLAEEPTPKPETKPELPWPVRDRYVRIELEDRDGRLPDCQNRRVLVVETAPNDRGHIRITDGVREILCPVGAAEELVDAILFVRRVMQGGRDG